MKTEISVHEINNQATKKERSRYAHGPYAASADELTWHPVFVDGKSIFELTSWLLERGITKWWWKRVSLDIWGYPYTVYFKNESDVMMIRLGLL